MYINVMCCSILLYVARIIFNNEDTSRPPGCSQCDAGSNGGFVDKLVDGAGRKGIPGNPKRRNENMSSLPF